MPISIVAAFWVVSILFVITPGVDWAYAIAAGMQGRVVIPAVAGLLFGHLTATLVVAAGVGALVAGMPAMLTILTVVGAAYLLWVGINMLRHPASPSAASMAAMPSWHHWAIKGACVSGLNPKVFLLFLALLPQFTTKTAAWSIPVQIVALGLIHIISCGVVYLCVGFSAQAVLQSRPRAARVVSRVSGAAMIMIGLLLITEQAVR